MEKIVKILTVVYDIMEWREEYEETKDKDNVRI